MRKIFRRKYKGLGFVESLIAIMVSGIVATVLINISVSAMKELSRLDVEDAQAHYARSTAVIVQNIASRERLRIIDNPEDSGTNIFYSMRAGTCYVLEKNSSNEYVFKSGVDGKPEPVTVGREVYKDEDAVIYDENGEKTDYFRIICIANNTRADADPGNDTNKVLIKITIGFNRVTGLLSTASDVRDYDYFAVINL